MVVVVVVDKNINGLSFEGHQSSLLIKGSGVVKSVNTMILYLEMNRINGMFRSNSTLVSTVRSWH